MDIKTLNQRVAAYGFCLRGTFNQEGQDGTSVLIGNLGGDLWPLFKATKPKGKNPLDRYTKKVLEEIAKEVGAEVYFPFEGPPFHPFQKWAQLAEPVFPSPIGPLVHPIYGLWHAYRALFVFKDKLNSEDLLRGTKSPCDTCLDKPCLSTCPVAAFSQTKGYDVAKCIRHLKTAEGDDCMKKGCRARRACPIGVQYIYPSEMAQFHMGQFVKANGAL